MIPELTPERIAAVLARRKSAKSSEIDFSGACRDRSAADIAKIQNRAADMPPIYRRNYLRAVSRRSMAAAIKAFCLECVQWERAEVTHCTAPACPLYAYRPFVDRRKR
jgi:hypothetical protein